MVRSDSPNLWEIRAHLGHAAAVAVVVQALIYTARLVNLDKNLSTEQIGEAANDVLEDYGYFHIEEVKYLLKRAVRSKQIYGRLDYNVIMGWFAEYDDERTAEAMRISDEQEPVTAEENAVDFATYLAELERKAKTDPDAAQRLADVRKTMQDHSERLKPDGASDHEFKKWRLFTYVLGKSKGSDERR